MIEAFYRGSVDWARGAKSAEIIAIQRGLECASRLHAIHVAD